MRVEFRVEVEYDDLPDRTALRRHLDSDGKVLDIRRPHRRRYLFGDRRQSPGRRTGLKRNRDGSEPDGRQFRDDVVRARESECGYERTGSDLGFRARQSRCEGSGVGPCSSVGDRFEAGQ